jgi:serine phosphatase RsbU (regulator of sigma subunit)
MVSGGDWWHYESLGPRRFRVYVADVTGRGADAALAAALMVGDIGGYAETGRPEADLTGVMQRAGERLHRVGANRFWMTMTVAELDLGAMTAAFWFASSPPVFIASRGDKKAQTIVEPGLPLGHHTSKVGYWQTALKKGDRILLFTDGATEQRMPGDMEIGLRRFQKIFMATLELDPREARAEIAKALAGHRGSRRQDDDVTFVLIAIE